MTNLKQKIIVILSIVFVLGLGLSYNYIMDHLVVRVGQTYISDCPSYCIGEHHDKHCDCHKHDTITIVGENAFGYYIMFKNSKTVNMNGHAILQNFKLINKNKLMLTNPDILDTEVKHSQTKDAWNVIGTRVGRKYKIARIPYLVTGLKDIDEYNKQEALEHANYISECFHHYKEIDFIIHE